MVSVHAEVPRLCGDMAPSHSNQRSAGQVLAQAANVGGDPLHSLPPTIWPSSPEPQPNTVIRHHPSFHFVQLAVYTSAVTGSLSAEDLWKLDPCRQNELDMSQLDVLE